MSFIFDIKIVKQKEVSEINVTDGFVVVGDIHLYNAYPYSDRTELISSRLSDLEKVLYDIGYVCRQYKLPLIMNGDIIHSGTFDFAVEHILTKFLMEFEDILIFINLGNHDLDGDVTVLEPLVKISKNTQHFIVTSPQNYAINKTLIFCFMPFSKLEKTIVGLKKLSKKLDESRTNVLFIHNTFSNIRFQNNVYSVSGLNQKMKLLRVFDMIVASHIHKYQIICNKRGFYTSSIIPLGFGERKKEHGYHIIDLKKRIRYFIIPDAPSFKYINSTDVNNIASKKVNGCFICVKVKDTVLGTIDKGKIKKTLVSKGALFVKFKVERSSQKHTFKSNEPEDNLDIKTILVSYSEHLSEKFSLKRKEVEREGLLILEKVKDAFSERKLGG